MQDSLNVENTPECHHRKHNLSGITQTSFLAKFKATHIYMYIYIYYIYIYIYIHIYIIYIYYVYIYTYIYPQTRVLSFPGFISVARVNEWRTSDVIGVLKAPGAELCQNACGVVNEQNIFCSHQCSPV